MYNQKLKVECNKDLKAARILTVILSLRYLSQSIQVVLEMSNKPETHVRWFVRTAILHTVYVVYEDRLLN